MKILILEANPRQDISLDQEIRELRRAIDDAGDRNEFRIKDGAKVRKDRLHKLMLDFEAEEPKDESIIVHFCGHGTGEKGLVFENKQGKADLIDTEVLADFLTLFKNRVTCVVMNACYSEVQAKAINKHIKYVIGMNQAIRDDAAIAFSIGFYRALCYDKSIEDGFKFGTNAIQLAMKDGAKSRDAIAEEMRKLLPLDNISEAVITQEYLKPVLKVNPDLSSINPSLDVSELSAEELLEALLDAYRDRNSLKRMVKFKLGKNLNEITSDTLSLHDIVFELIDWAESNGQLELMVTSACQDKSNNPKLKKICDRYLV